MNLNFLIAALLIILISVASYVYNFSTIIDAGSAVVSTAVAALVGGVFYFFLRVSTIFETKKDIEEFKFDEIKEALENNKFSASVGSVSRINAILKMKCGMEESYRVITNDNLRVLHDVIFINGVAHITGVTMVILQTSFLDIEDLVNYLNGRSRWKVVRYEQIFDSLTD